MSKFAKGTTEQHVYNVKKLKYSILDFKLHISIF